MSGTGWMLIALAYVLLAPVIGCLLSGVDRRLSARMQGRRGPPVMQPYYDVRKFLEKEQISSNHVQDLYVGVYLFFVIVTGILFFSGQDLLLTIFALTLGETFLILAAYSSGSPFSQIGAQRELYAAMSFEPIFLLTAIGFYLETGSFSVSDIVGSGSVPTVMMAGFLMAFVFGLTMKMRKSPFDLSMSHHAHQDLVRGLTTEFSGRTLAMIEISHWYENIMLLGMVALFFLDRSGDAGSRAGLPPGDRDRQRIRQDDLADRAQERLGGRRRVRASERRDRPVSVRCRKMSYSTKSPWILHYDASSCNGCDIEVLACLTPLYDVERFGMINTGDPKQADILLITGAVNDQNKEVVKQLYEQMPNPKVVVAIGICACSGGVFRECYNILGGVDTVIPVDVYVPGCAARPESIIDGVVKGLTVLEEKRKQMKEGRE